MDTIVYDAVQDVKAVAEYNGGGHRNPSGKRCCEVGAVRKSTNIDIWHESDSYKYS